MKSQHLVLSLALTALVACVPAATTVKRSPVQTTAALAQVMKSSYDQEHPEKMPLACLLARPQMMEDIAKTGTGQYLGVTGFHYQGTTAQALNLINANMVSTAVFEGYPLHPEWRETEYGLGGGLFKQWGFPEVYEKGMLIVSVVFDAYDKPTFEDPPVKIPNTKSICLFFGKALVLKR